VLMVVIPSIAGSPARFSSVIRVWMGAVEASGFTFPLSLYACTENLIVLDALLGFADGSYWHLSDIPARPLNGRYRGQCGRGMDRPKSTLMTHERHRPAFHMQ